MLKEHKYWIRTLETEVKYQVNRSIQTTPTFMDLNKSGTGKHGKIRSQL